MDTDVVADMDIDTDVAIVTGYRSKKGLSAGAGTADSLGPTLLLSEGLVGC